MKSLLLDEPPLVVLPSLAVALGLNEAIVLQQLNYWLQRCGKVIDGKTWVYNTADQWQDQFPFFSVNTIRRTLKNLRDMGIVEARQLSEHRHDHTLYYTINMVIFDKTISEKCQNDIPKMGKPCRPRWVSRVAQDEQIFTETTQETNVSETTQKNPPVSPKGGSERADESDTLDAFTPEELRSEPLPRGESRKQQEAKKRDADEKRTAIMAAFRSARFDRPTSDPIPVGEFNRMRKAADELLECGATPEQVREATDAAMLRFSTTAQVTLGAVSGNFTALLTPEVSRAPSSRPMSGADAMRERMEAVHKKHADILRGELEGLGYEGMPFEGRP